MNPNPIEEIKRIRHQLGADVGYDIHRIFADLRAARGSSDRRYIDIPVRDTLANQTTQRSGGDDVPTTDNSSPTAR